MDIDVGSHISEVLYDNNQVSIPGLGEFEADYQSSIADQVQGKVLPPMKQFVFKKVPGNDNFLVKYIKDQHNISYSDAQQVVENYVGQIKTSIDNKEIFVFPNIGRLYKDYEQELRFLPDKENFNKSSFGLPEVELFPALRPLREESVEELPIMPVPETAVEQVVIPQEEANPSWFQKNLAPIAAAAIAIVFFGLFTMMSSGLVSPAEDSTIKMNEPPKHEDALTTGGNRTTTEADDIYYEESDSQEAAAESGQPLIEAVRKATPQQELPKDSVATIRIAVYTNSIFADQTARSAIHYGFKPVTNKIGQSTEVSVVVEYNDELELDQLLADIRKRFAAPNARIIKTGLNQE